MRNNDRLKIIILGLNLLFLFSCSDKNSNLIPEEKKLSLANNFYNNELYEAAIQEYVEYVNNYDVDNNRKANSIYTIANIYFERLHDYQKALEYYFRIKYLYPESNLQDEIGKKIVNCLERLERSQDAQRVLNKETALFEDESQNSKPGEVLCTIGDKKITQGDLDFELKQLPPYIQNQISTKEQKLEFLKQKIAQELLYDSAKRKGLDKDKEILESTFKAKKEIMAQKILGEEIQKMINISEEDVELYYKANKDKYAEKDEDGKIKRHKSFQEAGQLAANDLMREKQEKAYTQLLERLMKAQNVKIFESKIR
jgi:peptidyl-prolyl cis-trans isomerase C